LQLFDSIKSKKSTSSFLEILIRNSVGGRGYTKKEDMKNLVVGDISYLA